MKLLHRATLIPLLCLLLALPQWTVARGSQTSVSSRYLLLIVMDGFRPDYMALAPMHHLHALMRSGMSYNRAWVGQLETETPTGHATIATGVYPRKHGVIGFVWKDPTGQNITWMPTDLRQLGVGAMERLIEAGGAPTLSDELHRQYPGARSASISGEKYYAADAMGTGADYILYGKAHGQYIDVTPIGAHVPPPSSHYRQARGTHGYEPIDQDQFVAGLADRLVQTVRPKMLLVNLPGTDIEGHRSGGPRSPRVMAGVAAGVDRAIGRILAAYKRAGIYSRTDIVVTADHGMDPNLHVVPKKAMYAAVRATHALWLEQDFLFTAGYLFLRDPHQDASVAASMVQHHFPHVEGALYKVTTDGGYAFRADPSTAAALGPKLTQAYEDLSDTLASFSGPDVVLPYAADSMGVQPDPASGPLGNHGGLSWHVQHIPLILSGPGVRHGASSFPAKLVDVAPTAERLLGLQIPSAVDGVVLADALQQSTSGEQRSQASVAGGRSADVEALRRHSVQQHALLLSSKYN